MLFDYESQYQSDFAYLNGLDDETLKNLATTFLHQGDIKSLLRLLVGNSAYFEVKCQRFKTDISYFQDLQNARNSFHDPLTPHDILALAQLQTAIRIVMFRAAIRHYGYYKALVAVGQESRAVEIAQFHGNMKWVFEAYLEQGIFRLDLLEQTISSDRNGYDTQNWHKGYRAAWYILEKKSREAKKIIGKDEYTILASCILTLLKMNCLKEALRFISKVRPSSRHYPSIMLRLAQCHMQRGNFEDAKRVLSLPRIKENDYLQRQWCRITADLIIALLAANLPYDDVLQHLRETPENEDSLLYVYLKQNQADQANALLSCIEEKLKTLHNLDRDSLLSRIAINYANLGSFDLALKTLERIKVVDYYTDAAFEMTVITAKEHHLAAEFLHKGETSRFRLESDSYHFTCLYLTKAIGIRLQELLDAAQWETMKDSYKFRAALKLKRWDVAGEIAAQQPTFIAELIEELQESGEHAQVEKWLDHLWQQVFSFDENKAVFEAAEIYQQCGQRERALILLRRINDFENGSSIAYEVSTSLFKLGDLVDDQLDYCG